MIPIATRAGDTPTFPARTIGIGLAAMIVMLLLSTFLTWRVGDRIRIVTKAEIEVLTSAQKVDLYGVILETAIKTLVAHGDPAAAAQYREIQPQLRQALAHLRKHVQTNANQIAAKQIDETDLALVAMEYSALDLVSKGQYEQARRLINSDKYDDLVASYVHGIRGIERRAQQFVDTTRTDMNFYLRLIVVLSGVSLLLVVLGWFVLIRPARRWGEQLDGARASAELISSQLQSNQAELEALNRKLFDQARIDPLTGLHTRLKFNEDVEQLWPRVERRSSFCAMMCDVDFFKQYKDTYGHVAGDRALRRVAQALTDAGQPGDQLYRFGGEEFLIILGTREADEATRRGELYRAAVEGLNIEHSASPIGKLTLSIGISDLGAGPRMALQTYLSEADQAMYEAKSRGRNSVVARRRLAA